MSYRILEKGEAIQAGDEVDASPDGWRDDPVWKPTTCVGRRAPDPQYPSHRIYRRKVKQEEEARRIICDECRNDIATSSALRTLTKDGVAIRSIPVNTCNNCDETQAAWSVLLRMALAETESGVGDE